jgi:hypothetical protein
MKAAAIATLVASAAGTGAWLFGLSRGVWPAHPMFATFLITILVYVVVKRIWPQHSA